MCFQKGCGSYRKSIRRDDLEGEFEGLLSQLTPSERLLRYLRIIFEAEWKKRLAGLEEAKTALKRERAKIEKQIGSLVDRIVVTDSASVIAAYERKIADLEKQKLMTEEKLRTGTAPVRSFEQMFELALGFLSNPQKLWNSEHIEDKRTVLRLAFDERIAYCRKSGLRTPKTTLPFKVLGHLHGGECKMAETVGFEPTRRFCHLLP